MRNLELLRAAEALAAMPRPTEAEHEANRRWFASTLARFTEHRRQEIQMSVATAAELAGLAVSEWYALEEGWVPKDRAILRAIAGTLRVRWTDYDFLAFWSECAQSARR